MKSNGEQDAFPSGVVMQGQLLGESGLTKREYFAGLVMQQMVAYGRVEGLEKDIARLAVGMANALLAELVKQETK